MFTKQITVKNYTTGDIKNVPDENQRHMEKLIKILKENEFTVAPKAIIDEVVKKYNSDKAYAKKFTHFELFAIACVNTDFAALMIKNKDFISQCAIYELVKLILHQPTLEEAIIFDAELSSDDTFAEIKRNKLLVQLADAKKNPQYENKPSLVKVLADNGRLEALELMLKMGYQNENSPSEKKKFSSLLHGASAGNHTNILKLLIGQKADVNATDEKGQTPLHAAVKNGNADAVELLLKNKSLNDMNNCDKEMKIAIDLAEDGFLSNIINTEQKSTFQSITETIKKTQLQYTVTLELANFIVPILIACKRQESSIIHGEPLDKFIRHKNFDINILSLVSKFVGSQFYTLKSGMKPLPRQESIKNSLEKSTQEPDTASRITENSIDIISKQQF